MSSTSPKKTQKNQIETFDEHYESSHFKDRRFCYMDWLCQTFLLYGFGIFGSVARYYAHNLMFPDQHPLDEVTDIDIFIPGSEMPRTKRLNKLANFISSEFTVNKHKNHMTKYSDTCKVLNWTLVSRTCEFEISLDVVKGDIRTLPEYLVLDTDINGFSLTACQNEDDDYSGDEVMVHYHGENMEKAKLNLSSKRFEFLLSAKSAFHSVGFSDEDVHAYYSSVIVSDRWCKLRNRGFKDAANFVPRHAVAEQGETCFLCCSQLPRFVWSSHCECVKMHHSCHLRNITLVATSRQRKGKCPRSSVTCPMCDESPLPEL